MVNAQDAETYKHIIDLAAMAALVGALARVLPEVAALFSIVWTIIRIWETETVKKWTGRA
jgi:hypothetical protein